ncbi:hypothetical protein F5Y00DRAFT_228248 [Daldinia vernicosa]|uniref:uncharacterized protein n=1 Tax=Daldinia vernicosa TaxID=114800 RepID=UPI0020073053|nr:uncharacterized protein F5Y00DRAFT_228248 [Daldinia vernicosa]KAI0851947.1 hypothetical protein F5Y00DRAFT_228248 [Daldinia vernicosa]
MRSSSYRRSARANNLRVFIRDDVPHTVDHVEPDSESEDEPDTPSPTKHVFPSPPARTEAPTQTPTQQVGAHATPKSSSIEAPQPTTSTSISTSATQSSSTSTSTDLPASALPQSNESSQAQAVQSENSKSIMSKDGAIALGTIGATIIIAAIIFLLWKCRRRQARANDGGGASRFWPFSGFKKIEEPREIYTTNRESGGKTQSKIMDDLMAAAYAAEDGNVSQYGAYTDEKRQTYTSMHAPNQRQSNPPQAAENPDRGSNSLYVNQLMSGFYKGSRADGLTTPANARMPPPPAPSVSGETDVTATTESTWRTWGWSQKKPPKESWVDKYIRLGGSR